MTILEPTATTALPAVPGVAQSRLDNPYWVYLARFTGESERGMRRCLDRLAAMITGANVARPPRDLGEVIPWQELRYAHTAMLRTRCVETMATPSNINRHLSALRGVLEQAWMLGQMTAEDYQRARAIDNATGTREPAGRNIGADEADAIMAACDADPSRPLGIRDAALIAVLRSTGIRRGEAASALIEKLNRAERALRVIGKGDKERTVYLHETACARLDAWLVLVDGRRGPIFRSVSRWGTISTKGLSGRAVGYIVSARQQQAGVAKLSTHDWRRTFIGDLIDAGGDLVQAQQLAGHASPDTTSLYDRRPDRAKRAAVDRMKL